MVIAITVEAEGQAQEKRHQGFFGGAIARQLLSGFGIKVDAYVSAVGPLKMGDNYEHVDFSKIESNIVRCPDVELAKKMIEYLEELKESRRHNGRSDNLCHKRCSCRIRRARFDKLHADLGKSILSINAVHGFEYGSGFAGAAMKGSEHNDLF